MGEGGQWLGSFLVFVLFFCRPSIGEKDLKGYCWWFGRCGSAHKFFSGFISYRLNDRIMERGHHVRRLFLNFVIFQEMEIAERGE